MLKQAKTYILSKFIKRVLNDPVYKTYYCYKILDNKGDYLISSVMCHDQAMIFEMGLRQKKVLNEIVSFEIIAQGGEDDVTDEKYHEENYIKQTLED